MKKVFLSMQRHVYKHVDLYEKRRKRNKEERERRRKEREKKRKEREERRRREKEKRDKEREERRKKRVEITRNRKWMLGFIFGIVAIVAFLLKGC